MTTNEKICKWLGMEKHMGSTLDNFYWQVKDGLLKDLVKIDFLHDRNQQKWIEDELEKREIGTMYDYSPRDKIHYFTFYQYDYGTILVETEAKLKNEAFISAIEQLIDKELTTK